jgi:hypothetical protein
MSIIVRINPASPALPKLKPAAPCPWSVRLLNRETNKHLDVWVWATTEAMATKLTQQKYPNKWFKLESIVRDPTAHEWQCFNRDATGATK